MSLTEMHETASDSLKEKKKGSESDDQPLPWKVWLGAGRALAVRAEGQCFRAMESLTVPSQAKVTAWAGGTVHITSPTSLGFLVGCHTRPAGPICLLRCLVQPDVMLTRESPEIPPLLWDILFTDSEKEVFHDSARYPENVKSLQN